MIINKILILLAFLNVYSSQMVNTTHMLTKNIDVYLLYSTTIDSSKRTNKHYYFYQATLALYSAGELQKECIRLFPIKEQMDRLAVCDKLLIINYCFTTGILIPREF